MWRNGGIVEGKKLSDVMVVPVIDGCIESRLPGYEDVRCIPVKNIAGATITVHSPITGGPIQVRPKFLTLLESTKTVELIDDPSFQEMPPSKEQQ